MPVVIIFLMASAEPPGHGEVLFHSFSTWAGGALGIVLQMALWPFRPQHPLRRATAECWQETGNLLGILNDDDPPSTATRDNSVVAQQTRLRETLDRTLVTLNAARSRRMHQLVTRLEGLHMLCARFTTQALVTRSFFPGTAGPAHMAAGFASSRPQPESQR